MEALIAARAIAGMGGGGSVAEPSITLIWVRLLIEGCVVLSES